MLPLIPVAFTAEMIELDEVRQFDCGTDPWCIPVSQWIKGEPVGDSVREALANLRRKTEVWLYYNEVGELVGYGSLGETRWRHPETNEYTELSCIPMLGVNKSFQGGGRRCGTTILRNLRARAEVNRIARPGLALFVHPQNAAAIAMYEKEGFAILDMGRNNHYRMLMKL